MIALYILAGIIALLFIILIIPINISFRYSESSDLKISYLFFKYNVLAENEEKNPKEKKTNEKAPEKKTSSFDIKAFFKREGLSGFLSLLKDILKIVGKSTIKILKHLNIKVLDIYASAGGEDASAAAMLYGEACAGIYGAYGLISGISRPKRGGVSVDMNYKTDSFAVCEFVSSIKPLFILIHGLPMLIKLLPQINRLKKTPEKGKTNE